MIYKWVPGQGRPNGKTWKTKPAVECFGENPVKIQFRFETVWMKMHDSRFVGGDNKRITTAALVVSDDVVLAIGYEDYLSVRITSDPLNLAWRNMLHDRINDCDVDEMELGL